MWARLSRYGPVMKRNIDSFLKDATTRTVSGPPTKIHSSCTRAAAPIAAEASIMGSRSIQLNPREQQLRLLLLDVAAAIDSAGDVEEPVQLRWAGGWVRDRLLGIESHDIDVAINTMTGVPFAQRMRDYCDTPAAIKKHAIARDDIGNLHNVAANPEKSKHLETAMVRMFALDLDFVNLRKETYAEDSRNPQMEFGTPLEDARRRDATINALFYNLHTDQVEDFTGGLPDMDARLIRTPLEPFQTFTDDPLRVLRLVRFASRLEFAIDPETRRFMADKRVLDALVVKISRERVGVELEKMLKGAHPRSALELIDSLGLYHAIFTDPAQNNAPKPDVSRWKVVYECLDDLKVNPAPASIYRSLVRTEEAAYLAWNLAALSPWMVLDDPVKPKAKANALPRIAEVAREGFKAANKLTVVISASYKYRQEILGLKKDILANEPYICERDRVGMAIRRWDSQNGSWRLQVLNAMLVEAMETLTAWRALDAQGKSCRVGAAEAELTVAIAAREDFLNGWQAFWDHLTELDVQDAPSMKRLIDGKELAAALGVKAGKWTGQALEVCLAWQLRNPGETDQTKAIEAVREQRDELGIPHP